ncbi:MAG: hypothetical protein A3F72_17250 [Bacteroidetes bacterium RIFCSPLOWO2_12_FULL_35_15]|nr:MAG: hypothetical protein A3F72_17250 [Bacteroidetes bacterium RIFCSPLOWO2_12_FULL_35_15]
MKKSVLIFSTLLISSGIIAQDMAIGNWRDHLSYKDGISVSEGNGKVYCATKGGVFVFNKSDNSTDRLSKVNGLSDVEASTLSFNSYNNKLLIAYKNSNIDIIENNIITNLSEIKRKNILGNKSINNIYFSNQYAYLACGFGIVVVDMDKYEISDTYYIGPNGNAVNVRDITSDANYLYAATDVGIYRASKNANLANFASWSIMSGLSTGIYNTITSFSGKIYTNYSKFMMNGSYGIDSLFVYDGSSWSHLIPPGFPSTGSGYITYELNNCNNQLVLVLDGSIFTFNSSMVGIGYYAGYFSDITRAKSAVVDNVGSLWAADSKYGLVSFRAGESYNYHYPNGPSSSRISGMSISEGNLWIAPGGVDIGYSNLYFSDGMYAYKDADWTNPRGNYSPVVNLNNVYDFVNVLVDPKNSKRVYAASWGLGVVEFYNGIPIKHYDDTTSSLQAFNPVPSFVRVFTWGLATDENDNLWVTNNAVEKSISRKTPNGTWQALDFKPILGASPSLGQILVDKQDQKWIVMTRGGGILVYKGHTMDPPGSANAKKLGTGIGNGALPSTSVFCLAEDLDGEIWVGTDKGVAVFYSPENVFSGQNFDSQQILLEQDGHVQILLETEIVQAIAVDDANRKWIATANSGVFLMSPDGTKQIYHFDENNSPLFSNDVGSIAINHETGEVYFGTSKGLISYRGTSIAGLEEFTDVYAFPNPVHPNYDGPIAIKGLMNNSTIKITDISGALVYEIKSEGGQAIWNGKNFNGEKVSSGVYMVFCTSEDGAEKAATKILFIN